MVIDGNPSLLYSTLSTPVSGQPVYPCNHPWYLLMADQKLVINIITITSNNDWASSSLNLVFFLYYYFGEFQHMQKYRLGVP